MAKKRVILDENKQQCFPITHISAVIDAYGNTIENIIQQMSENLVNLYYTKGEVDLLINDLEFGIMRKVDALPAVGQEHIIYLVPKAAPATGFDEWLWMADENRFELIGDTNIDLSDYYKKSEVDTLVNTEKTRAQGVEQALQDEILGQTGAIQTAISNANTATAAANTAATAANNVNATLNTTTNVVTITDRTGTSKSIDLTNQTNVELEGSVVKITDKDGNEEEIDLLNATNERVRITVTTNKENQSVAGLGINVYYNGNEGIPDLTVTTDANGQCWFDAPRTYRYRIVFPTIAGCYPITDVTYQAHASERLVDVEYKETFIPTHGENVTIILQEKFGYDYIKIQNEVVTVTYNGQSTDYTTDSKGVIKGIIIPFNTRYTITYPKIEGYYIRGGAKYTVEYLAEKNSRSCIMNYYAFESGVFIVSDEGESYNMEEWVNSGLPNSKAVAIKIATTDLQDNGGVFAVDIDWIRNTGYSGTQKAKFLQAEVLLTSIPENGTTIGSNLYFDGHTTCSLIKSECIDKAYTCYAIDIAKNYSLTVGGEPYQGFIGSKGQWEVLWSKIAEIDDILMTVRPDGQYTMSNYAFEKWGSTQRSVAMTMTYTTTTATRSKTGTFPIFPFFKINE